MNPEEINRRYLREDEEEMLTRGMDDPNEDFHRVEIFLLLGRLAEMRERYDIGAE